MKKKLIAYILIMIMILVSCFKPKVETLDTSEQSSDDSIQIWYYIYKEGTYFIDYFVENIKKYCDENSIPLSIYKYDENTTPIEEYIEKRNTAAKSGNLISFDRIDDMRDIANQHADYTKLDNYNNLLSQYKDRFCIPLARQGIAIYVSNDVMQYYDIDIANNSLLTYSEYLEIKQKMKEKGAKFEYNSREYNELLEYHLNSNGLLIINEESEIIKNSDELKRMLKKSIFDVCEDILLHSNNELNTSIRARDKDDPTEYLNISKIEKLYDENSGLTLSSVLKHATITYVADFFSINLSNKTFIFNPYFTFTIPNFYMHEKITNNKIYDVANYILSDSGYSLIYEATNTRFIPTFITDNIKKQIRVNDDWRIEDSLNATIERKDIINKAYELLFKNEERAREISDYVYYNERYSSLIRTFVDECVFDIAKELSGERLSLEKFDPNNKEIDRMINDKIDEFVSNFKTPYN